VLTHCTQSPVTLSEQRHGIRKYKPIKICGDIEEVGPTWPMRP
jgi:hypothetical protein